MATRAMVLRENGASFECYYRHCDGYPTGLGVQLIEALRSPFCKTWQDIVKQCELEPENKFVKRPEDAFLKLQGDLEYIYVVRENPKGLTIYRTTNPRDLPNFAFKIWFSYAKYFPAPHDVVKTMAEIQLIAHIALQALENYHTAIKRNEGLHNKNSADKDTLKPCPKYPCDKLCWKSPDKLEEEGYYCPFE